MQADRLQTQRFEIKYIVPESLALAARDFVRSYLSSDDFSAGQPNFSYPIHSLYLDSNDLTFYWRTIHGHKNRFKLRVRFYDDNPESPVFLEIKRRTNNVITKQRCPIRREAVSAILAGQTPEAHLIDSKNTSHLFRLQNFLKYQTAHGAKPKAHVAYLREAWVSPADNSVRVTMDRAVRFEAQFNARLSTEMKNFISVFGSKVILEIKFTNRFPDWFKEFVRLFDLRQCSAAKYAQGLSLFGERRMRDGGNSFENPESTGPELLEAPLKEVA